MSDATWVADDAALGDVVADLADANLYAVDTEFHRERTYYPTVALVQLAWDGHTALVDPLATDIRGLAAVFDGPGTAVMHAASQDIEVFHRACGTVPSHLFDTQIAAGFAGYGTPSLSVLVQGELGISLSKGDRLTDWLRRPLDPRQCTYAAADVDHLLEVHDRLVGRLETAGRLSWALDECERLRVWQPDRDPDTAYARIKEARQMRGAALGVVRAVAAWRERRAAAADRPPRHVLSDMAVVTVAQRAPSSLNDLSGIRGLDDRFRKGRYAQELLAAVAEGKESGPPPRRPATREVDRDLRPAVTLVSAWIGQLARTERIDTAILATRGDIEALLAGDETGRLSHGWRAELVGEPVRALATGEAALAFDGKGGLVLEQRSGQAL